MNYISTSELRTKVSKLRDSLGKGENVYLFHRSKIIGVVEPYDNREVVASAAQLKKLSTILAVKTKVALGDGKVLYIKHLKEKYGKIVS